MTSCSQVDLLLPAQQTRHPRRRSLRSSLNSSLGRVARRQRGKRQDRLLRHTDLAWHLSGPTPSMSSPGSLKSCFVQRSRAERPSGLGSVLAAALALGSSLPTCRVRHGLKTRGKRRANAMAHFCFVLAGAVVGGLAGNRLGAIRDAKGKPVGVVFAQLNGGQKAEVRTGSKTLAGREARRHLISLGYFSLLFADSESTGDQSSGLNMTAFGTVVQPVAGRTLHGASDAPPCFALSFPRLPCRPDSRVPLCIMECTIDRWPGVSGPMTRRFTGVPTSRG